MIRVGIAGIGFMGWIHWLAYKQVPGIQVAAVCEADARKLTGDWRGIKGNFGPPGAQVDLAGIATYDSVAAMLADPSIELVDICLPPSLHAQVAIDALNAGKDVFCEKPLALSAADCQQIVSQADQYQRRLMVGHVLPFFPEYRFALELIQSGRYGALIGGAFKRVISDPTWLSHFYDPDLIGGPMLDLHVHDAHLIRLLYGMPVQLHSVGRWRGAVVEYCQTLFQFADPAMVVSSTMGVINQQGRPFDHAFEIHLQEATLQFEFASFADRGESMPLKVLTADGAVVRPELGEFDPVSAFVLEITEVARALQSGEVSSALSGELARDAVILCQNQNDSVRQGSPVQIGGRKKGAGTFCRNGPSGT